MSENLKIWDQFADIDPKFTKAITGKPYKGTSPNPHYVIKCLTEMFGPVGLGFGWDVEAEGFQPMGEELLHWCRIRFWHSDQSSRGFSAYGQTKAVMKTRNGLMTDEDAPKKSLTDAITKAAAQVGIASNIFLGRWDDSKYVAEVDAAYREAEKPPAFDSAGAREALLSGIAECASVDVLKAFMATEKPTLDKLTDADFDKVKSAYSAAGLAMSEQSKAAE